MAKRFRTGGRVPHWWEGSTLNVDLLFELAPYQIVHLKNRTYLPTKNSIAPGSISRLFLSEKEKTGNFREISVQRIEKKSGEQCLTESEETDRKPTCDRKPPSRKVPRLHSRI